MAKSLQEQLISTGLIDKKKANKIKTEQLKKSRKQRASAAPKNTTRQDMQKASRESAERDKELNRRRQVEREQKAVAAQIMQLVQANRLPKEEGADIAFNFVVQGKVKKIYVDQQTRDRIGAGKLAIVEVNGQYDLVSANLIEKLRQRSTTCVVFHNDPQTKEEPMEEEYANHKVPDDLIW